MATQGLLSILKEYRVIAKIVVGCDGYDMHKVAEQIMNHGLPGKGTARDIAHMAGKFCGCPQCLVVVTEDQIYHEEPEELPEAYRNTFLDPYWNPRWEYGTCAYSYIVNIEEAGRHGIRE